MRFYVTLPRPAATIRLAGLLAILALLPLRSPAASTSPLAPGGAAPGSDTATAAARRGPFATMFWTWQDKEIENPDVLLAELRDLKGAGFDGLFVMPRATRYQLFDPEMTAAVKVASEACRREGIAFIWGPDPRFGAHHVVTQTGYGAEVLLTGRDFMAKTAPAGSADPERALLNEARVDAQGRFSLRYNYPARRDTHMLTEVSLWFDPVGVDRVFAYQRQDGRVRAASVRDVTAQHRFFINRALNYVEVFGRLDLPPGEWWVVAFPRFRTNMFAFDSPEHERLMLGLLDHYHAEGIRFDGLWWDEPGYYLQFGQYVISERIYRDFAAKYGYDLRANLAALLLPLNNDRHLRVRQDYFQLVMDYVFGAEQRAWRHGEKLFGPLRMGIHHNWHSLPDNLYHGSADYWRGVDSVDAGYTDDSGFEGYFTGSLERKLEQVSYLVQAASLGRFSRSKQAFYNRWGVNYGPEVPAYFNDLMPLFSNQWLQHSYGSTGAIGGGRNFGPGFPDHVTWPLLPGWIEKTRRVHAITGYRLPVAEVAVVYPLSTFATGREPANDGLINRVNRLVGAMPAAGVQADAISEDFFADATFRAGRLIVRGQAYQAVLLPGASVVTARCLAMIERLQAAGFPLHFIDTVPQRTVDGRALQLAAKPAFAIGDAAALITSVAALGLPSPVTQLPGAYVTAIRGDGATMFVLVMPITPGETVSGELRCEGRAVPVPPTKELAIFEVGPAGVQRRL
ncbi:hypothetical protein [Opitutus sp. ER46]|uniref:hypothetical protein n=1 Tax=Opitutus sp. ER46 TaxID=2161864 RepID=UPI000D2F98B7|nr:hypothetical protein [Opitutus sp. ER46]PTX96636.1 hypothetical protein DB354_08235 [Opitutus sp. ER46]